jgi:hypothetical protein
VVDASATIEVELPDPNNVLAEAQRARASGDRDKAIEIIESNLRSGLWRWARLWRERVSLMAKPSDYLVIRSLWLSAPRRCHRSVPIMRNVARAACAAGEHEEARLLLRKALVTRVGRERAWKTRVKRTRKRLSGAFGPGRPKQQSTAEPFDRRAAVALEELSTEFEKAGLEAFLISGTLLGYLREGKLISWDKDIDVGVFADAHEVAEIERVFDQAESFSVRRLDFHSNRLRVDHANRVMVDIFPHFPGPDGLIWHDGATTRWWNSPFGLKEIEFLGKRMYIPDNPERYLDENYGNWRVPEANFDARIDAPNVEIVDQDYFDTQLFFSLLDSISKNKPIMCARYRSMLEELGEGEWLRLLFRD